MANQVCTLDQRPSVISGNVQAVYDRIRSATHLNLRNMRSFGSWHFILEMKRIAELRRRVCVTGAGVIGGLLLSNLLARLRMQAFGIVRLMLVMLRLAGIGIVPWPRIIPGMLLGSCKIVFCRVQITLRM